MAGKRRTAAAAASWLWFALTLSIIGFSQQALAGCGDYVSVHGHHSNEMLGADTHQKTTHLPFTECHGPNCQRQTPAPASPWRTAPKLSSNDRACLLTTFDVRNFGRGWFILADDALPREGFRPDIEHPPRLPDRNRSAV